MKNFDSEEAHSLLLVMGIVGLIMLGGLILGINILNHHTIETSSTEVIITNITNKDFTTLKIITPKGIFNARNENMFNLIDIDKKYVFVVIRCERQYYSGLIKEYYELSEGV